MRREFARGLPPCNDGPRHANTFRKLILRYPERLSGRLNLFHPSHVATLLANVVHFVDFSAKSGLTAVHAVDILVHMPNKSLDYISVRLHPSLISQIKREAKHARRRPSEYLRHRIEDAFEFDPEVHEMDEDVPHVNGLDAD